ncbi:hypothetical protein L9F63_017159, partial [Diploptera punctata]
VWTCMCCLVHITLTPRNIGPTNTSTCKKIQKQRQFYLSTSKQANLSSVNRNNYKGLMS